MQILNAQGYADVYLRGPSLPRSVPNWILSVKAARDSEAGMAEAVAERIRRYIFDGTDQDLRRLLSMSEVTAEMARAAFRRVGLQEGWKAVPPGAVEDLPQSARQAGLEVAGMNGCFLTMDPELGFELHAASLAAVRERATRLGIAAGRVDDLVRDIRAAKDGGHEWVSSGFVFDLTLRKPMGAALLG